MSWGTCYKGSNNIHFNYPALMDDSRLFSEYYSSVFNDKVIKERNFIKNNSDYRKYLQVNTEAIIKNNQLNTCGECLYVRNSSELKDNLNQHTPYIFESTLSQDQPYGYETSDLKNLYLSRQQLDSQKHITKYIINSTESNN